MLQMFKNNTYADFRKAYKHVLIPSYIIQVIQQNQNVIKLNIDWFFGYKMPNQHLKLPYFILESLFFWRNIVSSPLANIHDRNSFKSTQALIFFWFPPFQNLGLQVAPYPQQEGGLILWNLINDTCCGHSGIT